MTFHHYSMQRSGSLLRSVISSASHRCMSSKISLQGIFPPVTTAFNDDESIAFDRLEENFKKWNTFDFAGYVVHGSNGESAHMNFNERVEMIRVVKQWIPQGKQLIAGIGNESTKETIALGTEVTRIGVDALLVLSPSFYKSRMTNKAYLKHFQAVADACPAPVIVYNVPPNTGIDLSADLIVELAEHPNIVGLKDSGGDLTKLTSIVHRTRGMDFQVLAGSASFIYTAYSVGCTGAVPALGNCLGEEVCRLDSLYRQGKFADALELQGRLIEPNTCVTRKFGVPGLKKAMSWLGLFGGPCRSPLLPLESGEESALRKVFVDNGFLEK